MKDINDIGNKRNAELKKIKEELITVQSELELKNNEMELLNNKLKDKEGVIKDFTISNLILNKFFFDVYLMKKL